MTLTDLLAYEDIVIQCHDNPDADAIASGWGLLRFFEWHGRPARLLYGGPDEIQKANLCLLVSKLHIPIRHVQQLEEKPGLLICVDCQYNGGKAQLFEAQTVAVIDHHQPGAPVCSPLWEVRSSYGACATVVWKMLCEAGMPIEQNLATALYYGLFMDTKRLEDLHAAPDIAMRTALEGCCRESVLLQLKNNNLSPLQQRTVGLALAGARYDLENRFVLSAAEPCDANILGIISDQLLETEGIDVCVAYARCGQDIRLSVRSCTWMIHANTLAGMLTDGHGGGHLRKAGGVLPPQRCGSTDDETFQRLWQQLQQYFACRLTSLPVRAAVTLTPGQGSTVATADITLGDCLAVRGLRVVSGRQGLFVAMPRAKDRDGQYHDLCFALTADMRRAIQQTVLQQYRLAADAPTDAKEACPATEAAPTAPADKAPALPELQVQIYPVKADSGSLLGYASVTLGCCFAIRSLRIQKGAYGVFVSMPRRRTAEGAYQDICSAATPQMRQHLQQAVLDAYHAAAGAPAGK